MKSPSAFAIVGPRLIDRGYSAIPVMPGSKVPGCIRFGKWQPASDWQRFGARRPTRIETEIWCSWSDAGVGVVCGGPSSHYLIAIDIDTEDNQILSAIRFSMPTTYVQKRGAKGRTLFFRGPRIDKSKSWNINGQRACDLIGPGRQTVLPPTTHPHTGTPYKWICDALEDVDFDELPELTPQHVEVINEALRPFGYREPERLPERPLTFVCDDKRGREYALGLLYGCADELACQREPGRNELLNIVVGRMGRCVARGWLSEDEAWVAAWNGCIENGLLADDGELQFRNTFASGLRYGLTRPMPDPRERLQSDPAFAARIANLKSRVA